MYVQAHLSCQNLLSYTAYLAAQRYSICACGNALVSSCQSGMFIFPLWQRPQGSWCSALSALHRPSHANSALTQGGRHSGQCGKVRQRQRGGGEGGGGRERFKGCMFASVCVKRERCRYLGKGKIMHTGEEVHKSRQFCV